MSGQLVCRRGAELWGFQFLSFLSVTVRGIGKCTYLVHNMSKEKEDPQGKGVDSAGLQRNCYSFSFRDLGV